MISLENFHLLTSHFTFALIANKREKEERNLANLHYIYIFLLINIYREWMKKIVY